MRPAAFLLTGLILVLLSACAGVHQKAGSLPLGFDKRNRYDRRDRPQGRWRTFYDSARTQPYTSGRYRHGRPVRTFKYYDATGVLSKSEQYGREGYCVVTDWYASGKPARRGQAQWVTGGKGARFYWFGPWASFTEQGDTTSLDFYGDGRQQRRILFERGRRALLETYEGNELISTRKLP